jgi:hypothetical protein
MKEVKAGLSLKSQDSTPYSVGSMVIARRGANCSLTRTESQATEAPPLVHLLDLRPTLIQARGEAAAAADSGVLMF